MSVIRPIFGRVGDGRQNYCDCSGCCGTPFTDFPEEIYVRIAEASSGTNVKTTMYRNFRPGGECSCGGGQSRVINYTSRKVIFIDAGWPESTDETCCVVVSLSGECSLSGTGGSYNIEPGACYWTLSVSWSGGESLSLSVDVTPDADNPNVYQLAGCDSLEITALLGTDVIYPACIAAAGGFVYTVQISESAIAAGTDALPCTYTCCQDMPDTLYGTISAPSCPEIDGAVITLNAIGGDVWEGTLEQGCCIQCGSITFFLFLGLHVADANPCIHSMSAESDGLGCTGSLLTGSLTAPACPPFTLSVADFECTTCCVGGTSMTVTITE